MAIKLTIEVGAGEQLTLRVQAPAGAKEVSVPTACCTACGIAPLRLRLCPIGTPGWAGRMGYCWHCGIGQATDVQETAEEA